jgi:hypothetical protein
MSSDEMASRIAAIVAIVFAVRSPQEICSSGGLA